MPYNPTELNQADLIHKSIDELYQKNGSYLNQRIQSLQNSLKKTHQSQNFNQIMQGLYDTQYLQSKLLTKKFKSDIYAWLIDCYTQYQNANDNLNDVLKNINLKQTINELNQQLHLSLPSHIRTQFDHQVKAYVDQTLQNNLTKILNGCLKIFDIHYELSLDENDQIHYVVLSNQMKNQYYYFLDSYLTNPRIKIELTRLKAFMQKKPKEKTSKDMAYAYQELIYINLFLKHINHQIDQWYLNLTPNGNDMVALTNTSIDHLIKLHQQVINNEVYKIQN